MLRVSYCDHSPSVGVRRPSVRPSVSLIMELIGPELSELSALELEKIAIFDFVYTLASDQSVPNLVTIYMPVRSRMSLIMGQIEPEYLELFALEFGNIAENDFVYTLSSTNINQSASNLVKVYLPLNLEKLLKMTLFTLYHLQILTSQHQTWSKCI